jgi:hypothetical protein
MATLRELYDIWADDGNLEARFLGAALKAAQAIDNEDPGTTNHANRVLWANEILGGDSGTVRQRARELLRRGIAWNATFQSQGTAISDSDIEFIVSSLLNDVATGA